MTKRFRKSIPIGAFAGSLVLASAAATVAAVDVPRFVEETATSGVSHQYDGGWEFFVGGGVAAFDCNSDGRSDLFFAWRHDAFTTVWIVLFDTGDVDLMGQAEFDIAWRANESAREELGLGPVEKPKAK